MTANKQHTGTLQVQDLYGAYRPASAEEIIRAARTAINRGFRRGTALTSPAASQDFLKLRLAALDHEVFAALWLDTRHRVISFDVMFHGTIDGASVHPREVVKAALGHTPQPAFSPTTTPPGLASLRRPTVPSRHACKRRWRWSMSGSSTTSSWPSNASPLPSGGCSDAAPVTGNPGHSV